VRPWPFLESKKAVMAEPLSDNREHHRGTMSLSFHGDSIRSGTAAATLGFSEFCSVSPDGDDQREYAEPDKPAYEDYALPAPP
jgi:hypothetical protein